MHYPDQLHGYREPDLRLCFRLCRLVVFSRVGSFIQCSESVVSHTYALTGKICHNCKIHLYKGDTSVMVLMFCLGVECLCCLHLRCVFIF